MVELPFRNRFEAGHLLGLKLAACDLPANTIVLGLPRGGVAVSFEVARALGVPLDVVVARKVGVPTQPELAMGAVAGGKIRILDEGLIQDLGIPASEVDAAVMKEFHEVDRREKLYRHGLPAPDLCGWTVILVDDGLAAGSTMSAAIQYVNSFHPAAVIIAVPVASAKACQPLRRFASRLVCFATPEPFLAVGEWYADFRQVTDLKVQQLLELRRRQTGPLLEMVTLEPELPRKL